MSTPKTAPTATHPSWCHPEHCVEDADDSICHFSAPKKLVRDEYELTVVIGRGDADATHEIDLGLSATLLSAAGLRELISDLQRVENDLEADKGETHP